MKQHVRLMISTIVLFSLATSGNAQATISRNELGNIAVTPATVSNVKVVSIHFPPAQKAPYHKHPCAVVGQIISGECLIQIEGQHPIILKAGDLFYEPANTPVIHFDNSSDKEPLLFTAYYLTNGEKELTEVLHKNY